MTPEHLFPFKENHELRFFIKQDMRKLKDSAADCSQQPVIFLPSEFQTNSLRLLRSF